MKGLATIADGLKTKQLTLTADQDYTLTLGALPPPYVNGANPVKTVTVIPVNRLPVFRVEPVDATAVEGKELTFHVNVDAYPEATLTWQSSTDGTNFTDTSYIGPDSTHSYYTLTPALSMNGLYFRCVATNAAGSVPSAAGKATVIPLGNAATYDFLSTSYTISEQGEPTVNFIVTIAGGATWGDTFTARTYGAGNGTANEAVSGVNYHGFSGKVFTMTHGQTGLIIPIPFIDDPTFNTGDPVKTVLLILERLDAANGQFAGGASSLTAVIDITGYSPGTNTAPTTTGLADVSVAEQAADTIIDLFSAFSDAQDTPQQLTYTVQGNTNTAVFEVPPAIDQNAGTLTLNYKDAAGSPGTSDITVRATDTGGLFVEASFTVTVAAAGAGVSHAFNGSGQLVGKTTDNGGLTFAGDAEFFEDGDVARLPANINGSYEAGIDLAGTAFASTYKAIIQMAAGTTAGKLQRVSYKLLYNDATNSWIDVELVETAGGSGRLRLAPVTNGAYGQNYDLTVTTHNTLTNYVFNLTAGDIEFYVQGQQGNAVILPASARPGNLGSKLYLRSITDYGTGAWGDLTLSAADSVPQTVSVNAPGSWNEGATYTATVTRQNADGVAMTFTATMTPAANYPFTGNAIQTVYFTANENGTKTLWTGTSSDDGVDNSGQTANLIVDDGR